MFRMVFERFKEFIFCLFGRMPETDNAAGPNREIVLPGQRQGVLPGERQVVLLGQRQVVGNDLIALGLGATDGGNNAGTK